MALTDAVQIEVVRGLTVVLAGLPAAAGAFFAAYFAYKASEHTRTAIDISKQTLEQSTKVEQNTNHLKDELVAEVRKASIEVGKQQEKDAASERETNFQAGKQAQREGNPS